MTRMAVTIKLYSESTTARRDVTGEPNQVYDMDFVPAFTIKQIQAGNALSIFRIDNDCQWLHITAPKVIKDINDNPEYIVGNSSEILWEFCLLKIHVSKLCYFPIIGESCLLPMNPEVN